jgi:hypothetical protein
MARHLLRGVVVLWSCVVPAFASERVPSRVDIKPTVLAIAMVGECQASDTAISIAQKESARVWSRADVHLRWVGASELPFGSPDWLVVQCVTVRTPVGSMDAAPVIPIASIRFLDSRPTNTITLSIVNADTLLQRDSTRSTEEHSAFFPYREIRLGRMLGRAIAHEVGHFLSGSGEHTSRGLMKRTHSVAALTGASLGPFSVDTDGWQVARMPKS